MALTEEQKKQRDELRAATLGEPSVRKSCMVEWNKKTYEVRRPSIGRQLHIDKLSSLADGTTDKRKQLFLGIIGCVFVPGTDVAVFEPADEAVVMDRDMDDFVGVFMKALTTLNSDAKSVEAAEKN